MALSCISERPTKREQSSLFNSGNAEKDSHACTKGIVLGQLAVKSLACYIAS